MSNRVLILTMVDKIDLLNDLIAKDLLADPHCLDGQPQKEKVYDIVLRYFAEKQEASKDDRNVRHNSKVSLDLAVLLNCHDDAKGDKKQEYAKKIACYVQDTPENWLKIIPNEYLDNAFRIIKEYLEQQKGS